MSLRYPAFDRLIDGVQACASCARMCNSVRVLSWANGDPRAPLMFIGEAPGRLGADRTAIPFHGDKAGDNFERLLALAGLNRSQVFVTNAVLCNPRDHRGNNAPPSVSEITNCARHLKSQIEIGQPRLVMTLGTIALEATRLIEDHKLVLRDSVRTSTTWFGRLLIPLYHPGARAMIHRSFANQTADYYFVGETFRRLDRRPKRQSERTPGDPAGWELVKYILQTTGRISNFRLHKLVYLIDVKALETLGQRATNFLYLRQKDGPYCVELGSSWYRQFASEVAVRKVDGILTYDWKQNGLFSCIHNPTVDERVLKITDRVLSSTASITDSQLKTRAYLTAAMKRVLRAEKSGEKMLNQPLLVGFRLPTAVQ